MGMPAPSLNSVGGFMMGRCGDIVAPISFTFVLQCGRVGYCRLWGYDKQHRERLLSRESRARCGVPSLVCVFRQA